MPRLTTILNRLKGVDTAALCDADKSSGFQSLQVMSYKMKLRTRVDDEKMIGIARTIQTRSEDFMAVLRALDEGREGEILCVNTQGSRKAVAGGLFLREAERRGLSGIIIDGAVRDVGSMSESKIKCYSTSVNPYSGSILDVGETQVSILCGGAKIRSGDIVIGDADGIIVADIESLENIIDSAENIVTKEAEIMDAMKKGQSLHSLTNYSDHFDKLQRGKESTLKFK